VLGHTIVFVAGAALAEELCDEKRFRKYVGGPIVEIRYAVHDSLFTAFESEASWGVAHRIIAPHLSLRAMAHLFDDMRDATAELVEKWARLAAAGAATVSAIGELNRLNLETTTLTLYGKKLNCLTGPDHPMLRAMEDSTSEAMKRPTRPGLLNSLVFGTKFKTATKMMRAYAADIVAHRKANPTDRHDLLDALLTGQDPDTGEGFTESQVIDEIVTMPIGSSTAPGLLSAAIYFLCRHPNVVNKARVELDAVLGDGFKREHLAQMPFTEAILRESLRLSFAAPGFNIEPIPAKGDKSPVLLGGGKYSVAHDQAMIIVLAGVNRDPAVFEDPLAFKPERMLGAAYDKLPLGVRRGFGNGKRECIGKHWAWQFSMVTLATLLRNVDFDMADPDYELKQDGWFNLRPVEFDVKVKPRAF
jgi:cytochrome P450